jgi:hypothetical protein
MDRDPIERLLDFWFGPLGDAAVVDQTHRAHWFVASADFDRRCREAFATDLARAAGGELDHWCTTPRGQLALIVLLDQLSRNIYRGTARAFAQDAKALALCQEGLARGPEARSRSRSRSRLQIFQSGPAGPFGALSRPVVERPKALVLNAAGRSVATRHRQSCWLRRRAALGNRDERASPVRAFSSLPETPHRNDALSP